MGGGAPTKPDSFSARRRGAAFSGSKRSCCVAIWCRSAGGTSRISVKIGSIFSYDIYGRFLPVSGAIDSQMMSTAALELAHACLLRQKREIKAAHQARIMLGGATHANGTEDSSSSETDSEKNSSLRDYGDLSSRSTENNDSDEEELGEPELDLEERGFITLRILTKVNQIVY